jgi:hypothetical protein
MVIKMKQKPGNISGNRKEYGHTILEVLVVCALLAIAGILVTALCRFGMQSFRIISTQIDNQQKSGIILNKINRELSNTRFNSIKFIYPKQSPTKGSLALSFVTPLDKKGKFIADKDDTPIYQAHIIYFLDKDNNTLKRKRIEIEEPGTEPAQLDDKDFISYLSEPTEIVATNVEEFKALSFKSDDVILKPENPFKIFIKIEVNNEQRLQRSSMLTRTFRFNQ